MATKKTCTRCHGKGWGSWHVDMGRCFRCNGCGETVHYTMSERVAVFVQRCDVHLVELTARAAEVRESTAATLARRAARRAAGGLDPRPDAWETTRMERELDRLRETYRTVRAMRTAAIETGRVTAQQQAAVVPATVAGVAVGV